MFPASTARNYARGLVAAAGSPAEASRLAGDLQRFVGLLDERRDLGQALTNATLPLDRRIALAQGVLEAGGAARLLGRFLAIVLARGHARGLKPIAAAVSRAAAEAAGSVEAEVRTAHPATPDELARIQAALAAALGRPVEVRHAVDPALIGGFVARARDLVFDASMARQLERLRDAWLGG